MDKAGFAQLIDAYADAKVSGNKILVKAMIGELEAALNSIFPEGQAEESTLGEVEITPE
tara:strand:+ start:72 stop:248 length:177 start_codon:yes stop_codon:yes gene_type:complete